MLWLSDVIIKFAKKNLMKLNSFTIPRSESAIKILAWFFLAFNTLILIDFPDIYINTKAFCFTFIF